MADTEPKSEQVEERGKVYLEIGAGEIPGYTSEKPFSSNDQYIATDLYGASGGHKNFLKKWPLRLRESQISFQQADAMDLPLEDESVDEVLARNLFGYPPLVPKGEGFLELKRELGPTREAMINQIKRVLKVGGRLVICETLSPEYANKGLLEEELRARGFEVVSVSTDDPDWDQKRVGYATFDSDITQFLIFAQKQRSFIPG